MGSKGGIPRAGNSYAGAGRLSAGADTESGIAVAASIAGIILVARFNSAQADTGKGWELDAIAAAVIGGTSLAGGSGSILGVVIGACIMGAIKNGLVLMRVSSYWQTAVIGIIIVLAAGLDRLKAKRS